MHIYLFLEVLARCLTHEAQQLQHQRSDEHKTLFWVMTHCDDEIHDLHHSTSTTLVSELEHFLKQKSTQTLHYEITLITTLLS